MSDLVLFAGVIYNLRQKAKLRELAKAIRLWVMKLRFDLLDHLTSQDILEEAAANQHRYKAEPTFSKTGTGYLSPKSTEDSVREEERSGALGKKLIKRSQKNGKKSVSRS